MMFSIARAVRFRRRYERAARRIERLCADAAADRSRRRFVWRSNSFARNQTNCASIHKTSGSVRKW